MTLKTLTLLVTLIHFLSLEAVPITTDELVIDLPDGKIRGTTFENPNGLTYYGFQGIPFAAPPVGNLRFEAPQPPAPWPGILNATTESPSCVAGSSFGKSSEDCLYLNVYTPNVKPKEKLPVMFWIYGGAFEGGNCLKSRFNPDYLVEKDVIFVSSNYRVGAFGFLSTADEVLPGNMGIKDQHAALEWTFKNIEKFGGDPEKITIFGQSSGGTSVGLHILSKKAKGLFRAAILESGSNLEYWSVDWDPRKTAYMLADSFPGGNYGNDTLALKTFLQSRSLEEIINAYNLIPATGHAKSYPTIEVEHEHAYLTQNHIQQYIDGDFNQVPIIIGICSEEALGFDARDANSATKIAKGFDNDPISLIPRDVRPNVEDVEDVAKAIQDIYLNEGETFVENLQGVVDYLSDDSFGRAILKQADLSSKYVPTYLYQFSYMGKGKRAFIEGVGHGAEKTYLFQHFTDPNDKLTQEIMVALWTNFAKYLNPTPETSELLQNQTWPVTSSGKLEYININKTLEVKENLKRDAYEKWNNIYEKYGEKPLITF